MLISASQETMNYEVSKLIKLLVETRSNMFVSGKSRYKTKKTRQGKSQNSKLSATSRNKPLKSIVDKVLNNKRNLYYGKIHY